ncbi:MAG: hypothetical protein ACPIOQ_10695 [Promethearchaeia archaeon]
MQPCTPVPTSTFPYSLFSKAMLDLCFHIFGGDASVPVNLIRFPFFGWMEWRS